MQPQSAAEAVCDALSWFIGLTEHEHVRLTETISGHAPLLVLDSGPCELVESPRSEWIESPTPIEQLRQFLVEGFRPDAETIHNRLHSLLASVEAWHHEAAAYLEAWFYRACRASLADSDNLYDVVGVPLCDRLQRLRRDARMLLADITAAAAEAVIPPHYRSDWLSVTEAATRLQVSRKTVQRHMQSGKLRFIKGTRERYVFDVRQLQPDKLGT
jgi:excisionase family DNA binding protein